MIPALLQTPMLNIPTVSVMPPMAVGVARAVDFGMLLAGQSAVPAAVKAAVRLTAIEVAAPDGKLTANVTADTALADTVPADTVPADTVPADTVPMTAKSAPQSEQQLHTIDWLVKTDVASPQPPAAQMESAITTEVRTAIAEQAPPMLLAPVPQLVSAAPQTAQQTPALQPKIAAEDKIKIAVAAETRTPMIADMVPPFPAETVSAPSAAFADVAELAAKPLLADPVAQVSERVLDVARGSDWLDQLAGDILAAQDDSRDLRFRLSPPQLGQLDVRIETLDAGLKLDFAAQTDEAAQIVMAAQPRLVEELRNQGVRVAGSDVATASGQNSSGGQRQPHNHPQNAPQYQAPHPSAQQPAPAQSGRFA